PELRGEPRDAPETEHRGDQRDHEEHQRVVQHQRSTPFLPVTASRTLSTARSTPSLILPVALSILPSRFSSSSSASAPAASLIRPFALPTSPAMVALLET